MDYPFVAEFEVLKKANCPRFYTFRAIMAKR
jgi:hypothetical protein